ncbi:MAG TPA: c-type cytochrome [Acidimicrobiia bacterium]|nr:c-type cytochrome [Acidimicrobiia bacterium]
MSLSGAAEALGLPEALVMRSAEARAAETGESVDDILAAWAGGEAIESAPATATPEPEASETAAEPVTADEEAVPEPAPEPVVTVAEPEPAPTAAGTTRAPIPAEVTVAEAAHLPEVVTVPTAGIRERTNFVIPRWLTALMLVAPLVALFALGGSATGACGEATELTVDVISGEIINCDGSEFTGGGAGGGGTDFIALGGDLYAGNVTPAANCSGCHGAGGQGGVGPALTGVLTTFGACDDHITWVRLGSEGWRNEIGATYGDTNKQVTQGMPPHASLTEEQLKSVVAFERVRFGGAPEEEALADCGLAEEGGEAAPGGGGTDLVAVGDEIYSGAAVSGVNCAGCHGANGEGGVGPPLAGVTTTFGSCADHIEWVSLGSAGFPDGHGDTNKPTEGGMPAFAGSLSAEQIAAVSAFERVRFGGGSPEEVSADCSGAGGGEEAPADGEAPAEGETPSTTTAGDDT